MNQKLNYNCTGTSWLMPKREWWGETDDAMGWESETMQRVHRFKVVVFFC